MKLLIFLLTFLIISCRNNQQNFSLTILHTNDEHGHFWKTKDGIGGLAARKTIIDNIKRELKGKPILILSAGDINTGYPRSDLLNAEPDFIGLNHLGYDAVTVGNHEFDKPREVLQKQMNLAKIPFLSANIFFENSSKTLLTPYIIKEFGTFKVAIVGFTTETTPNTSSAQGVKNLKFKSAIEVAKVLLPEIKKKSNMIIVLSHLGCCLEDEKGDENLASAVKDIDLIVGGHSHVALKTPKYVNKIPIVQAGKYGEYLGKVEIEYSSGKTSIRHYELIPINLPGTKTIPEDDSTLKLLKPYYDKAGETLERKIGEIDATFYSPNRENKEEVALGRLVAASQIEITKSQIGLINGGGLRASLIKGPISYEDLMTVLPFKNKLVTVELSASELKKYFESILSSKKDFHVAGVKIIHSKGKILSLLINNKNIINSSQKFKFVTCDFLGRGGSNYPDLRKYPTFKITGIIDVDALKTYIEKRKIIKLLNFSKPNIIKKR